MKKIPMKRLIAAVACDDMRGFCLACGAEAYNVEPDREKATCESCGEKKVYGAEQILFMVAA